MKLRKILPILLLVLVLSLATTAVYATGSPPTYNSGSFNCNQVTFSYTTNYATVNFRIVDGDDNVISNTVASQYNTTATLTITLNPAQDPGTVLQIQHDYYRGWTNFGPATACQGTGDPTNLPPPPPWQHFGGEDAYGAFRFFEDPPGNPIMVFLNVENDGHGNVAFYISQKMLESDFPCDGTTQTLYTSQDGKFNLYLRPDCHIQANVGPDAEGKMHIISFETIPPGETTQYWTIDAEGHVAQRALDPTKF